MARQQPKPRFVYRVGISPLQVDSPLARFEPYFVNQTSPERAIDALCAMAGRKDQAAYLKACYRQGLGLNVEYVDEGRPIHPRSSLPSLQEQLKVLAQHYAIKIIEINPSLDMDRDLRRVTIERYDWLKETQTVHAIHQMYRTISGEPQYQGPDSQDRIDEKQNKRKKRLSRTAKREELIRSGQREMPLSV